MNSRVSFGSIQVTAVSYVGEDERDLVHYVAQDGFQFVSICADVRQSF